ncbi:SDR family NAD(P)-dependent oxidoreductase [Actinomadura livida]|uniref:NAD(P)-dependent dehydrogenase (Short-subunit alcohol dehydrogenase family) n=1 Tax=Actinomadura livida TaxID=79909 RepID=A0A7W7IFA3_9ACTN|nr:MULTISPECIES: SDR family NAD(P)-dependent oxidoreductase [Actinomadura]MBB4775936.1 NAD(P)-dependent dehydrogenase (short-subunit alcohol dehydrogenase family) [Actinomadura catellatispora]GGU16644.1 3-oxoacyl-ACP reductase [Actinomadura livida]
MNSPKPAIEELISLSGRIAVVTGAAQGIGRAIGERLCELGAHVVFADQRPDVHAAAEGIRAAGGRASSFDLDVTDEDRHLALVEEILDEHGALDIWVNNAGIYPASSTLDLPAEEWRAVLAVNLDGAFYGARAAARAMVPRKRGVILNVGSTSSFRASNDGMAHYVSSKFGLRGLTQAFAKEFGPLGIRVLGIAPTATATQTLVDGAKSITAAQSDADSEEDLFGRYAEKIPLRRIATPDDIARVAAFCVSDLAGYVTGTVIPVDGGHLAS